MNLHNLKSWTQYFSLHLNGELEMSIRKNDRDFQVGDICRFNEWNPHTGYTGNKSNYYRIRYILKKSEGLCDGYVVLLLDGPYGKPKKVF